MFYEGQQIGLYTLIRKLGRGGFGEVWLAERKSKFVTTKVAVKLPLDEQVDQEAIKQEASIWEQASGHPNVLPIIDADIYDGQVVIVSEYAEGGSLADRLKSQGAFPIKQAVEITIGVLKGLEFLHKRQIIHRDIKPQNILLQDDTPRLADFGISRAIQTDSISSTIVGTDAYMSPESFSGKRNIQTDIWSVGVVLYQLLKGFLPFPQQHPSERMYAILQQKFEPLPANIPQNIQNIIAKALVKLPENRYQTASEMRGELQRAWSGDTLPPSISSQKAKIVLPQQSVKSPISSKSNQPINKQISLSETETIVKPKSSTNIEKKPILSKPNNIIEKPNAQPTSIPTVQSQESKNLISSMISFAKLFLIALFFVGIVAVIIGFLNLDSLRSFIENWSSNDSNVKYSTPSTPRPSKTISQKSKPSNQIPTNTQSSDIDVIPSNTIPQQKIQLPCQGRINNPYGNVKLRSFAVKSSSNTIMELSDGAPVYIQELSSNGEWFHVKTMSYEGWIGSKYAICE